MIIISVELYPHARIDDALQDVKRSLWEGYGAGTLTNPRKSRDYLDEDFLGFWTSVPNDMQKAEATLLIEFGSGIDEADIPGILNNLSTFITAEDGMVKKGQKVVRWKYRADRLLSRT